MKQLLFLFGVLLFTGMAEAQPGTLDPTFGDKGFVYNPNNAYGVHYAIIQQPDGKLLTAGGYDEPGGNIARFLIDGTIDSSFGKAGFTGYPPLGAGYGLLLQKDAKIVVVGSIKLQDGEHSYVARLQTNGSFDSSFGANGITLIPQTNGYDAYFSIAAEPDGSFVISGASAEPVILTPYTILSHLSADGTFDTKFGNNGQVANYTNLIDIFHNGLATQPDGKILVAGQTFGGIYEEDYVLSRYNPDGSPDKNFGGGSDVITQGVAGLNGQDEPCGIVLQPDGKILLGGTTGGYNFVTYMAALRYDVDGTLDNSFGEEGRSLTAFPGLTPGTTAILQQPDGKIILSGNASNFSGTGDFALCRLNTDGSLDESFGVNGEQLTAFSGGYASSNCATLQVDGKIVQGGSYFNEEVGFYDSYLLARYNNDSKGQSPLVARVKRFLHNHGIGWQGLNASINYYSVQYSKTGSGFTETGKVSGAGSSAFQQYNYNVADAGYYRVVAVDRKGYKTFSNKVTVSEDDLASAASVFPNPARNYVTVQGLKANETASISIADGSGTIKVRGVSNGAAQYSTPLGSNMQPGTYYLNITTGSKTEVLKFVKE